MFKILKNKNGITLIALVITIIVLLILAGISISMLSGDNSILQKATDAKTYSDSAQIKERIQLAYHSALTGGQGSYTKESLENELKTEFGENNYSVDDSDNTNWILNAKGQSITIPAGKKEQRKYDRTGLKVGDYVTYTPPKESVLLNKDETGVDNQTLTSKNKFRIMNINDDGSIDLIGIVETSDPTISVWQEQGYNNGVYALNAKCSELYANETKGITARSIRIEDITSHIIEGIEGETSSSSTGLKKLIKYQSEQVNNLSTGTYIKNVDRINNTITNERTNSWIPNIFQYEFGGKIGENNTLGTIAQSESYNGYGEDGILTSDDKEGNVEIPKSIQVSKFTIPYTAYKVTFLPTDFTDSAYHSIFFESGADYWMASRCILAEPWNVDCQGAIFCLRCVDANEVSWKDVMASFTGFPPNSKKICPVISINSSIRIEKGTNDGTSSNPYSVVIE